MSLNRVCVIGNLTRDVEVKFTPAGVQVVQFGIAVQNYTKDEEGKYGCDFFNVTAWRKTAEFVGNYLKKGMKVSVDGRLQQRSWVDQEGNKRSVVEIVAESVQNLSPKVETETGGVGWQPEGNAKASAPVAQDEELDATDPFADEV